MQPQVKFMLLNVLSAIQAGLSRSHDVTLPAHKFTNPHEQEHSNLVHTLHAAAGSPAHALHTLEHTAAAVPTLSQALLLLRLHPGLSLGNCSRRSTHSCKHSVC